MRRQLISSKSTFCWEEVIEVVKEGVA